MLKKKIRLRKAAIYVMMTPVSALKYNYPQRKLGCEKRKKRCTTRRIRRRCSPCVPFLQRSCHSPLPIPCRGHSHHHERHPCPSPCPPPIPPHPEPNNLVVEKDCCGSIVLQGIQAGFYIWEIDVNSNINVAQVSIYLNSNSTDPLEVLIKGDDKKRLLIPQGSTANYIGQGIRSIKIPSQGNEMTYVEGKYVITTTLQIREKSSFINAQ